MKFEKICPVVTEEKLFKGVDRGQTEDGRNASAEPSSGELIKKTTKSQVNLIQNNLYST